MSKFWYILKLATPLLAIAILLTAVEWVGLEKKHKAIPKLYASAEVVPQQYGPIIRLTKTSGEFFCSGFVVDNNYALTAEHCVKDLKHAYANKVTLIEVIGSAEREDFALIKGDFREYGKLPFIYDKGLSLALQHTIVKACGYPEGSFKVECTAAEILGPSFFFHEAYGELYPGMSGGPVIDANGIAVGINSHVSEEGAKVYFSRLTGIPGRFNIEPKE